MARVSAYHTFITTQDLWPLAARTVAHCTANVSWSTGTDALVTSANFTEAAQERNIELGLLVRIPTIAMQVEDHFYNLIQNGHLIRLPIP